MSEQVQELISDCSTPEGISMKELDVIDLPDGRHRTVVHVASDARMIIIEVGSELIDYTIEENRLKKISRMAVWPEDLASCLIEGKMAADPGEPMDVTDWTQEQIAERFFTDHRHIEKLVQIAATKGIEAALEYLDGIPEEDDEIHRAALRALDDDERNRE